MPLLKAAWDAGIQTWDTADIYSNVLPDIISNADIQGLSEIIIGKAIEKYKIPREKLVILTKCFGTVYEDSYPAVDSENTKEYVNKHGI